MSVYASYFNQQSNRVVFKSVEADPNVRLVLDVDRTIRLSGESGQALLSATGPAGDVELVPELAEFKSSDDKTVKVAKTSGAFAAGALGEATITAGHAAAREPVSLKLRVYDPGGARLVFAARQRPHGRLRAGHAETPVGSSRRARRPRWKGRAWAIAWASPRPSAGRRRC